MEKGKRILILGGGPAGYVAAIRAAQLGGQVTVIEAEKVGGTCLHRGCIPTKALIASADLYDRAKRAKEFGLEVEGVRWTLEGLRSRVRRVVDPQEKGIHALFKSHGVANVQGRGRLVGERRIEVARPDGSLEAMEGDAILIATGSRPALLEHFPFDGSRVLTSDDALRLERIPSRLLIVGAGVIGCEFACLYAALGVEVTLVEMLPRILSTEDEEIAGLLDRELKKQKVKVHVGVSVAGIATEGEGVRAMLSSGQAISVDQVLVSIGRRFNVEGIDLDALGIPQGKHGEILVDNRMETPVPGVYAAGDVTGGMLLAHVASREGIVAVTNALEGEARMDYETVPAGIFTRPEIGRVGLTEQEALDRGDQVQVGRFPFRSLGKAHVLGEIAGMVKIVADRRSGRILGTHIIGPHAADLVHEASTAMSMEATAEDLARAIHAHPTLSEALMEAAEDLHGRAIHLPIKA